MARHSQFRIGFSRWVSLALGAALCVVPLQAQQTGSRAADEIGRVGPSGGPRDGLAVLLERVDGRTVRGHQLALQQIADQHGGNRAAGTSGYDASAAYVADRLTAAGYAVTLQAFEFNAWLPQGPSTVEQVVPYPLTYVESVDFKVMTHSDAGDVTAAVEGVDLRIGTPNLSTSGCEAVDFAAFTAGSIALIQRGACSYKRKAENAAAAGAVAAIIFNQGNTAERRALFEGSVATSYSGGIPVFSTSFNQGLTWALAPDVRLHLIADVFRGPRETVNVIAETRGRRPDAVVMGGAHLDSVRSGPGLQDNGSGSAALLAIAEAMADLPMRNTVRFAWWGAEESGLLGSYHYVNALAQDALDNLALYLNLDMIGSPNFVRFVMDSDGSTFGTAGAEGSAAIEETLTNFFAERQIPIEPSKLSFRSDYAPFHYAGVPVGGLFTGAEGVKSAAQALVFGGTSGEPYDGCYHTACDDFDNVAIEALATNADAAANALYRFATERASASAKARRRPGKPPQDAGCHAHASPTLE